MIKEILVPVDGSDYDSKAIEFAAELGRPHEARVHLIHVVRKTTIPKGLEAYIRSEGIDETPQSLTLEVMGKGVIQAAADKAKEMTINKVETAVLKGDPSQEIINYVENNYIDMVIMGGEGMGSITINVCHQINKTCVIVRKEPLEGKRILLVDDDLDVLETLEDLLSEYETVRASTFDDAKGLLEKEHFDIAILDIMGVDGFKLLELAIEKKALAIMLTANALSIESTLKSFGKGAASYVPKEKMVHITTYINDVLEAKEKGMHFWSRWMERFGDFYNKRFGAEAKDLEKELSS